MDYRDLLKRYMEHVNTCEGVSFVTHLGMSGVKFADEEIELLEKIDEEIGEEWKKKK